jgi:aspartyl-tRNA(Asn)/glutamyl-tRNA(Gln) amidotransferase subunit A
MDSLDFIKKARSGEISIVENTKKTIDEIKKIDREYNYFNYIGENEAIEQAKEISKNQSSKNKKGKLYGLPVSIKDCICVKDMQSMAGSRILEGYKPVFDATVVEKIKNEGAIIIGRTSQDAFGFGSFNVNVGLGFDVPKNPYDKSRVTGGSSGGAAGITKKSEMPHIALSESTGGSIACPAAYCGVYGMTPTYGRVSRYGLMDYANSLDKIGVMAKEIEEIALMMEVISGHDKKDSTSMDIPMEDYSKISKAKLKIAVIKESIGKGVEEEVKGNILKMLEGVDYKIVSLPLTFKYGIQTYYLISMSEASTNLAKYCGMRYGKTEELSGNFNEFFSRVRSNNLSKEEKRRIILGTFARMSGFRDAYYLKALKVRTKIIDEYKELFKKYDLLITPSMPNIAPKFSDISKLTPLENYMMDIMTVGPNLAGLPHLSIPSGFFEGMPTSLMAISDHFEEKKLIDFARWLKLQKK